MLEENLKRKLVQLLLVLLAAALIVEPLATEKCLAKSDWVEDGANVITEGNSNETQGNAKNNPLQAHVTRVQQSQDRLETGSFMNQSPLNIVPYTPPREVKLGSNTYRNWLSATHPNLITSTNGKSDKNSILEIQGSWDDAGHALRTFGFPYTRISSQKLLSKSLVGVKVMIVDCGCNLAKGAENIIRQFVYSGGYLITTDWALDSCLDRCFPGYLEPSGRYSDAAVVDAEVTNNAGQLTAGVISPSYWKLEFRSQFVRRINPEVRILVRSPMISRQDPYGQGILAANFSYGRGAVLHLVAHFDTNSGGTFNNLLTDPSPEIVVSLRQALAANFIAYAMRANND